MPKTFIIKDEDHIMEFSEADNLELGDLYIVDRSKCIFGQETFVVVDSVTYRFVTEESSDGQILSKFPIVAKEYP
jgi:hypothetical protein